MTEAADRHAGWLRRQGRKRFRWLDARGREVVDPATLARIAALRIPPGWRDVRVSPSATAKLQAVGFDSKGRKQYVYHADWVAAQAEAKYARLLRFGQALPRFREVTSLHLAAEGLGRERVMALVTRLLDAACFRIGGERYTRANGSFGVATLRVEHLRIGASALFFAFRGKRGIEHRKVVADPALTALAREVAALPGSRMFQYVRADGAIAAVTDAEVNRYVKEVLGPEFSAKDFRTWGATLRVARCLAACGPAASEKAALRTIRRCIGTVADHLGNTPAICKASYISPRVLEAYMAGHTLSDSMPPAERRVRLYEQGHTAEEIGLMALLAAGRNG